MESNIISGRDNPKRTFSYKRYPDRMVKFGDPDRDARAWLINRMGIGRHEEADLLESNTSGVFAEIGIENRLGPQGLRSIMADPLIIKMMQTWQSMNFTSKTDPSKVFKGSFDYVKNYEANLFSLWGSMTIDFLISKRTTGELVLNSRQLGGTVAVIESLQEFNESRALFRKIGIGWDISTNTI